MRLKTRHIVKRLCMIAAFSIVANLSLAVTSLNNGEIWRDTSGNQINAHGGCMMYYEGTYYWYGEYKGDFTYRSPGVGWECYRTEAGGVSCYSSKDLVNWKFEGIALEPDTTNTFSDIHPTMVIERPKVVYNEKTKKFVMWMHIDSSNYSKAAAGVAVSDSPTGKFTYIDSYHPNNEISRDITMFKDDDGKAYIIFSSEDNATLHINELSDDYLTPTQSFTRNFPKKYREAPAVLKHNGKYYMVTSGCTGWDPNEAEWAIADNIMGPYKTIGNPCQGQDANKTFYGQSAFAFNVQGLDNTYIVAFDKWNKRQLNDSRYIWLLVKFDNENLTLPWTNCWLEKLTQIQKKSNLNNNLVYEK